MVSYNNYRLHFNEHYCVIGATVKIFNNERSELTGIFFQDSVMKSVFGGYPEILIDATYKLNKFRMPLYILLVIDGNGLSEIIGILLTSVETEDAISKMWHSRRKPTFRRKNTKMSYLYHVVALTLLYLLVLVALQSMLLFPSYKGKRVDH